MREVIVPRLANKLIVNEIVPCGLSLIVYDIVSGLTLIAQDRALWFGINSLRDCVQFNIDSSR